MAARSVLERARRRAMGRAAKVRATGAVVALTSAGTLLPSAADAATRGLPAHETVIGSNVAKAALATGARPAATNRYSPVAWGDLSASLAPGAYLVRFVVPARTSAVEVPVCAGRGKIWLDGREVPALAGPAVVSIPSGPAGAPGEDHVVEMAIRVGDYERRIACGQPPRAGVRTWTREGLGVLDFESVHEGQGGGHTVVFVPPGHDEAKPATVLVGTHPWNGGIWTYAAYAELLAEAAAKDVVLLMPSGLGNSLYTAPAEDEVLAALDALATHFVVDRARVSIWGASMGGAGATTIGFHHPGRFASVTSLFGDSKYDLSTYVRGILHDESGAHLVNALDVVDNARRLPVWLIHGESDKVSPIAQSEVLASALEAKHYGVRFDRVPGVGHAGALVARFASEIVDRAAEALVPDDVTRVTFTSVRPNATVAYGVAITRASATGDAMVDVEGTSSGVRVHRADGVTRIRLARGALGTAAATTVGVMLDAGVHVDVVWDPPEPGRPRPDGS